MIQISSTRQLPWLLAVLLVFTSSVAFAQDKGKDKGKDKADKPKSEAHAVVMVDADMKILKKAEVKAERQRVDRDYKEAVKSHRVAAAEARKAKQKFSEPKPKKAKFKVLGNFKSEEEAQKFVTAQQEKDRKKGSAKNRGKTK